MVGSKQLRHPSLVGGIQDYVLVVGLETCHIRQVSIDTDCDLAETLSMVDVIPEDFKPGQLSRSYCQSAVICAENIVGRPLRRNVKWLMRMNSSQHPGVVHQIRPLIGRHLQDCSV